MNKYKGDSLKYKDKLLVDSVYNNTKLESISESSIINIFGQFNIFIKTVIKIYLDYSNQSIKISREFNILIIKSYSGQQNNNLI